MAARMGIPTLIQEQNSYPGITTRMLAPRVNEVHVTFAATRRFLRRQDNVHETGNPVRSAVGSVSREQGAAFFGLRTESTTLLVTGGSQGSASINAAVLRILPNIREQGLQVIWLTGEREFAGLNDRVREMSRGVGPVSIRLFGFLENMEYAFAAADIVLCRSGATTLAELLNAGLPSILVPYPFAAADHQTENAKTLAEHGAAVLLPDGEVRERLWEVLSTLVQDAPRRALMAERARSLARPDAAQVLAKAVIARAEQRHG
jgi:UDP-N-acetylglucosamine--N-acetylmuramyl-(pentapeptide) pyrophosphoryl-undecaprenol N-acetylglucosamine transferase